MQGLKIFFTCAFGALVDGLVALQLAPALWWIGSIVGFAVGYLSWEFKVVVTAVQDAWAKRGKLIPWIISVGTDVLFILLTCAVWIFFIVGAFFSLLFVVFAYIAIIVSICEGALPIYFVLLVSVANLAFGYVLLIISKKLLNGDMDDEIRAYLGVSPLSVAFFGLRLLFRLALKGWRGKGVLVHEVDAFMLHILRAIHSDVRLMCGVYSAIGAGIGYCCGNVLIGALAGGILGVVNYYLVGIKLLKVVPTAK